MSGKLEILAPAGGPEQLEAAVRCGANAVYLGTAAFNARRSAHNFEREALIEAVNYCHARGVAVHVTLNTIVFDSELAALTKEIESIALAGADAVIVQDLAVAKRVRECCPELAMHASTQMTVHNPQGVALLEQLGFSRAVLARELSLAQIETICAQTSLEIETFVHGALCMSASGACYLSAALGARSGNRGRCAQPCRLNFVNAHGREYALSLKDMCHIPHIHSLAAAGVCSLKIEGRMKRPEYVAAAVTAARCARDGMPYDLDILRSVFSRSGFTDGYLQNKRNVSMFGYRTREDADESRKVLGRLAELTRNEYPALGADMSLSLASGISSRLAVSDGTNTVEVEGMPAEAPRTAPTDDAAARKSLEKTGGTPFFLRSLSLNNPDSLALPPSALNAMRREALEKLLAARSKTAPKRFLSPAPVSLPERTVQKCAVYARAEKAEQLTNVSADLYILPAHEASAADIAPDKLACEIPALVFTPDDESVLSELKKARERGVRFAWCDNLGAIKLAADAGLVPLGGFGLNVANSIAAAQYAALGLKSLCASFEASAKTIAAMRSCVPLGAVVYGHLPLMRFRCCPAKGEKGCGDCGGTSVLRDRTGEDFTVLCSQKRYSSLLNPVPLYVSDKPMSNLDFKLLYFTFERAEECAQIAENFRKCGAPPEKHTNGLYFRALE